MWRIGLILGVILSVFTAVLLNFAFGQGVDNPGVAGGDIDCMTKGGVCNSTPGGGGGTTIILYDAGDVSGDMYAIDSTGDLYQQR